MSEREEYTPTTDEVRETYERARYYLDDMPEEGDSYRAGGGEFDAWLAAHDRALREQIAREYGIGDLTSRPLRDAQDEISRLESLVRYLRRENRRLENTLAWEKDQTDE